MPTPGVLFGTIGLIRPGHGVVVAASGTYPGRYSALIQQGSPYDVILSESAPYLAILGENARYSIYLGGATA